MAGNLRVGFADPEGAAGETGPEGKEVDDASALPWTPPRPLYPPPASPEKLSDFDEFKEWLKRTCPA